MIKKLEGKLYGPSHERGGIKFNLGGEIQEAGGGEFVIKKDSVNNRTEALLNYINKYGNVPDGLIRDARNRREK